MAEARCFRHSLKSVCTSAESLSAILNSFNAAIASSIELVLRHVRLVDTESRDSVYTGSSGIALMFIRLSLQLDAAGLRDHLRKDIQDRIPLIVKGLLLPQHTYQLRPAHVSPLDSPLGAALVYMFANLEAADTSSGSNTRDNNWICAIRTLGNAVTCAIEDQSLGGDEVLYGRSGLLWAMLNLNKWVHANSDSQKGKDIARIVDSRAIEQVIERIIEAGKFGAQWYGKNYGEGPLPLMWPWHDKFYIGAVHGAAGILTVLLQAPRDMVMPMMGLITECISALCDITVHNGGYLPSSLPAKHRTYEYIQICHGSPGLLLLLATFKIRFLDHWKGDWEAAEALAAEKVWEEGLVRKGLGVCHGVSGNAWTLLLSSLSHTGEENNEFLSHSLAFLLKATELPPLVPSESSPFRTPDHPLSLFEGLSGAICAWLDACIAIRVHLGEENVSRESILGLPGLGGTGAYGYL